MVELNPMEEDLDPAWDKIRLGDKLTRVIASVLVHHTESFGAN